MDGYVTGFGLECRKMKRTGLALAFAAGGALAAAFPVLNMAVRAEMYTGLLEAPVKILLDANWQMMAMLNILLIVAGACLMYHTEYAEHAIEKMCMLPLWEGSLFFGKAVLLAGMCAVALLLEAGAILCSGMYWFGKEDAVGLCLETGKNFGCFFLLSFPAVLASLGIACACKNMWVSLGIGVVCVFIATLLPSGQFVPSLFPYALPFQIYADLSAQDVQGYFLAGIAETAVLSVAQILFLKVRRSLT